MNGYPKFFARRDQSHCFYRAGAFDQIVYFSSRHPSGCAAYFDDVDALLLQLVPTPIVQISEAAAAEMRATWAPAAAIEAKPEGKVPAC